jgi:flagellar protein FlaG
VHKPAPAVPKVTRPEQVDSIVSFHKYDGSPLHFSIEADSATKKIIVKLVDQTSGEVLQQIPPETILRIARAIDEMIAARQRNIRT